MINKDRSLHRASIQMREPAVASVSYAIWLHGSLFLPNGDSEEKACYDRAREYLLRTEVDAGTAVTMSLEALQATLLLTMYELKRMYFSRAWISLGKAVRMALMMGLHRMDRNEHQENVNGNANESDWVEVEEKRRTFWTAFILDRFSNIGTDWPMMIDEKEVS